MAEGDQLGSKELSASPCWPMWMSWLIITVPCSWHESVTRRKGAMTASSPGRKLPRVSTPVGCTGIPSATIMAAPPRPLSV